MVAAAAGESCWPTTALASEAKAVVVAVVVVVVSPSLDRLPPGTRPVGGPNRSRTGPRSGSALRRCARAADTSHALPACVEAGIGAGDGDGDWDGDGDGGGGWTRRRSFFFSFFFFCVFFFVPTEPEEEEA
jgi:hypothetical protein